jgi:Icc-related predicted phosphoesterase
MQQNNLIYLEHETFQLPEYLGSHTLFVSPYAPMHLGGAFMLQDMSEIWDQVPAVDILVTHTPPFGFGDKIVRGRHVGCTFLRNQIDNVIQPKVSIFGHIHEAHGFEFDEQGERLYINACLCDHRYRGNQAPITFDL